MVPALFALFRNSYPKKKDMMERIGRIQMLCTLFDKNVGQENAVRFSPSSAGAAVDSVGGKFPWEEAWILLALSSQ